jgi:Domain of unknown function (DUF5597)/Beta-galactosidase
MRTLCYVITCALSVTAAYSQSNPTDPAIAHLEKRGAATQLIVDGKPFLALSGELANTASSDLETMKTSWPLIANKIHVNTVLTGMAWSWVEPQEGKYDFRIADAAIENANKYNIRIAWLWFASWKNGLSSFPPAWVKADQGRFPRAQIRDGKSMEVLSTLSENNWQADARAFAALMKHVREVDKNHRVIMVQMENEVGLLGDSRDRSPLANAAFAKPVPKEFMDYLQQHKDNLLPEFRKIWEAAGFKTSGTWEEVFGKGPKTDEIFMGWNYSRYIDKVAEAGKREYPVPMFVNAWIVQPEDKGPGDYPSGGPQDHMHDIWRAGAPHLDMLCPDIYLPNFVELTARYSRSGNPLYIPESAGDLHGAANAFFAIGQHNALGYSSMGIDSVPRLLGFGPGTPASATPPAIPDIETLPLPMAYATLANIAPLVLDSQAKGAIAGVWLNKQDHDTQFKLGGYTLNVTLTRNNRAPTVIPDSVGYAIVMATGPDEFYMAGNGVQVTFSQDPPASGFVGLAEQEAGRFNFGKWVVSRYLAGDDSVLEYDFPNIVAANQSGSGVRLSNPDRGIQRVKVYKYK